MTSPSHPAASFPQPQQIRHVDLDPRGHCLRVRGELSDAVGAELYALAQTLLAARPAEVVVELSAVSRMDSLGGAWLIRLAGALRRAGISWRLEGARGQVDDFLQLIRPSLDLPSPAPPRASGFFEGLGAAFFRTVDEVRGVYELAVDTLYWGILAPLLGKGLRWSSLIEELATIGVRATFIVVLMNTLMGLVIALLSATQLRQFGAEVFVADLVVIAFARELAPMMTAIIVAARSGSAIAAELATMVVQEEIDALKSMGLNTAQFLVVPKFWAMLLAMPTLTILAMFAGTFGGMEIGVWFLGITPQTWIRQTLAAVTLRYVLHGLVKSVVFGATIVFVGCHNGLRVRGGAQGVGRVTTRAVVMDVVLIIVLDMVFALLFEFVV